MPPVLPGDNAKECAEEAKGKASDVHNLYAVRELQIVKTFQFIEKVNFFQQCFFECYSERNGIVSGNSVNLDTLNGFADAKGGAVGDAWKAVFEKCAGTSDEIIQSIQGHSLECNPYALELKTCFVFEIDRVCPDEHFQSSELCDKIRGGTPYCHHQ